MPWHHLDRSTCAASRVVANRYLRQHNSEKGPFHFLWMSIDKPPNLVSILLFFFPSVRKIFFLFPNT